MDIREEYRYTKKDGTYTMEGFVPHLKYQDEKHGELSLPVVLIFSKKKLPTELKSFPVPKSVFAQVDGMPAKRYLYRHPSGEIV